MGNGNYLMGKLLLLFIAIPAVELILLLKIGGFIGIFPTVGIILATGVLGAALARQQGLGVLQQLQEEMQTGHMPAGPLADGIIILVAAALLMTPGFVTDLVGFLCLVPASRAILKRVVWTRIRKAVERGNMNVYISGNRL